MNHAIGIQIVDSAAYVCVQKGIAISLRKPLKSFISHSLQQLSRSDGYRNTQCHTMKSRIQLIYLLNTWNSNQFLFFSLSFRHSSLPANVDSIRCSLCFSNNFVMLQWALFFLSYSIWWIFLPKTISIALFFTRYRLYLLNSRKKYLHFTNGVRF